MYHKDFVCYFLFPSSHILIDTRHIKMFVLDEADEMLSRGFKDQIYDVFRKLPSTIQVRLGWEEWHTTVSSCHLLHTVVLFPSLIPRPSSGHDHSHHDPCYSIATVTSLCSLLHSHPLTYPHAIYDVHMHTHLPHPPTHILPPYVPHPHISHILTYPTPSHPHPPTHLTPHTGDSSVCHNAYGCTGCDQKVHERTYSYLGQEGGTDVGGYQAVLHPSGEGGEWVSSTFPSVNFRG